MLNLMIELLTILAVWRVTSLLYQEDGPYKIFEKIRETSKGAFECFWCLSLWVSIPFALALHFDTMFIIYWLAYSAGAILIESAIDKLDV